MTDAKMPVISAVTPCLNDGLYLPEMIESFLAQDYPHKELIVQDGGSMDNTHEILKRYPVRWNVAPDSGPHDAINKAILVSRGDVVVILPANDLFAPGAFSRAARELSANPELVMVYGDCRIVDEDRSTIRIDKPGELDIDRLFWTYCLTLQSAYIRREAFERVGMFDPVVKGPGDTEWFMRMVAGHRSKSFLYVPEVWSSFRLGHTMKHVNSRNFEQAASVLLAAHERFLSSAENRRRLRHGEAHARAGMHCQCASWLSGADKRQEAWSHFCKALRHWPGLLLSALGLKYSVRIMLGRNLTRSIATLMLKVRAASHGC